jgi:hypothetical protein
MESEILHNVTMMNVQKSRIFPKYAQNVWYNRRVSVGADGVNES